MSDPVAEQAQVTNRDNRRVGVVSHRELSRRGLV